MDEGGVAVHHGSPAWAGIDLQVAKIDSTGARFPRVGGDRPLRFGFVFALALVPPRGRG